MATPRQVMPTEHVDLGNYLGGGPRTARQRRRYQLVSRLARGCSGVALDYGCGLGDVTAAVADRFESMTGVDILPERIEHAREQFPSCRFEVCRPDGLDFPAGLFDTVISCVVIAWVDDADAYLAEIVRVMNPGGHLVLVANAPPRLRGLLRCLAGRPPEVPMAGTREPLEAMLARLSRHGLRVEAVDCMYEPLRDTLSSAKNVVVEGLLLPFRILHVAAFAPTYGIRAVRPVDVASHEPAGRAVSQPSTP